MKISIMQPYFFPYIGYFQLINTADLFIIYDTVTYIKNGWINRNRYLLKDEVKFFTLSLDKASSFKLIKDTYIIDQQLINTKEKIYHSFYNAYCKAPYFRENISIIEELLLNPERNISLYNEFIIRKLCENFEIKTKILLGSSVLKDSEFKNQSRIIEICNEYHATHYINAIGGKNLYSNNEFNKFGIKLSFIETKNTIIYKQWGTNFFPNLSIIDMMMFIPKEKIISFLAEYSLVN